MSFIIFILSCNNDEFELEEITLADYLEFNISLELADLVACAGGNESGLLGNATQPTDVFFYPIEGATDF